MRRTNILDFFVRRTIYGKRQGAGTSRQIVSHQSGKDTTMIKVEDIQSYGKEHFETVVASATTVQNGLQAIATAYGDSERLLPDDRGQPKRLA